MEREDYTEGEEMLAWSIAREVCAPFRATFSDEDFLGLHHYIVDFLVCTTPGLAVLRGGDRAAGLVMLNKLALDFTPPDSTEY